jgi:[ribosomal protein S5]-alanine N-acetyltransferase
VEDVRRPWPHLQDPAIYDYIPGGPPLDVASLAREFERLAAGCPRPGELWLNWTALLADEPVATLQATVHGDVAMIGYTVFPAYWGRGIGTAGVCWVLSELFTRRGVRLVHAYIDRRNRRSLSLVDRLGFRMLPADEQPPDTPSTDEVFELSRAAWSARAGAATMA